MTAALSSINRLYLDEAGVLRGLMYHVHDLDHVQVDGLLRLLDAEDGVRDNLRQLIGHRQLELGAEGSAGYVNKHLPVVGKSGLNDLDVVEYLEETWEVTEEQ
jgi:hypothetical protein